MTKKIIFFLYLAIIGTISFGIFSYYDNSGVEILSKFNNKKEGKVIFDPGISELKQSAILSNKQIGTAVKSSLLNDSQYQLDVINNFTMITPEFEGNMVQWWKAEKQYDFSKINQILQFAKDNNLKTRMHPLEYTVKRKVDFIEKNNYQKPINELLYEGIYDFVFNIESKFPQINLNYTLSNENIGEGGEFRQNQFYDKLGKEYMEIVAKAAMDATKDANGGVPNLCWNDFGIEWPKNSDWPNKSNKLNTIIGETIRLKELGYNINCIGFQSHLDNVSHSSEVLTDIFNTVLEAGLKPIITEMDYGIYPPVSIEKKQLQSQKFYDYTLACLNTMDGACDQISFWGVSDNYSWMNDRLEFNRSEPLFIDSDSKPKIAYCGILSAFIDSKNVTEDQFTNTQNKEFCNY